jgi:Endonuclease-reverse transcriptase
MMNQLILNKLTLLQYNVNKSRDKVLIGLLEDSRVARFDILAVQEPWRNPFNNEGYNPRNSPFYLVEKTSEKTRTAIYVNKRILPSQISEIYKEEDLISLRISLDEGDIYIHNIYNPPTSHSERTCPSIFYSLGRLLETGDRHIILGDLNLHHPLWNNPDYLQHHHIADDFLDIMGNIGAILHTPRGLATRDCQRGSHHEKTTIDLIFSNLGSIERCEPRLDLEQSSDHIPIATTFLLEKRTPLNLSRKRLWN